MFRHVNNQKGFTLLELLIVMSILSIILIAIFQVFELNYSTMNNALEEQETRDNLRVFDSYIIQDVLQSDAIDIQNESTFDVLMYTDYQGETKIVKFSHHQGLFEIRQGEEVLIAKAIPFDDAKPMVYEQNGLIYFNVYAKDVNALLDIAIQPRVAP